MIESIGRRLAVLVCSVALLVACAPPAVTVPATLGSPQSRSSRAGAAVHKGEGEAEAVPEAEAAPGYLLLEPVEGGAPGGLRQVRALAKDDPRRAGLEAMLARPFQRWELAVSAAGRRQARARCGADAACAAGLPDLAYFVVMRGGNHPRQGLALATAAGVIELPTVRYVEIDPERAATLVPHEHGHVIMFEALPGELPEQPGTLPHTTGAITDDLTAFSEGWGIHFETLAGDRGEDPELHARLHRDGFASEAPPGAGDSLLPAKDLLSYSQSYRRYGCIKDNCFAFLPRPTADLLAGERPDAADLLARWTDTTYDPARLRSLEQMVASEGVIAALFYRLATAPRPGGPAGAPGDPALPDPARYAAMLTAFGALTPARLATTPAVLVFLHALIEAAEPAEKRRIARIALEVFHYTPVVADAAELYAALHAAGHAMDMDGFMKLVKQRGPELTAAVERLADHPEQLAAAAAPELWLEHPTLTLGLPALGLAPRPLVFDLNAAPLEFLVAVPGITLGEARALDAARRARPGLRAIADVARVKGVRKATAAALRAMHAAAGKP